MNIEGLHVVVVGGAAGGCAAALLLARAGARVTLIEPERGGGAVGAGIALAPNGWAVLESLGLAPALAASRPVEGVRITDAAGRTLLAPPQPAPRLALLRRSTLQTVLLDAVAGEPGIEPRFGCQAVHVSREGSVAVRCGETGQSDLLHADLVIGADGVHSCVRWSGDFGARVRKTGIQYVRALVGEGLALGVEAWTAAGVFGSFPVDQGTYLFASCGTAECRDALAARDLPAFRAAWAHAYPPSARLLDAVGGWNSLLVNDVIRVDCARWVDGALALLGDAAHAMAPNLGQGANSALVDAAVLLDELRRGPDLPTALSAYQARRLPAVRRVADASGRIGRLAEVTHPAARRLRDRLLLPLASALATERTTAAVLQEPPARLLAIGRA